MWATASCWDRPVTQLERSQISALGLSLCHSQGFLWIGVLRQCAAWLEIVSSGLKGHLQVTAWHGRALDTEQGICLGSDSLLDFLHDFPLWKAIM